MSKAALVFPGVGMDAGARRAGLDIGFILDKVSSYEYRKLSLLYPGARIFGDPINFPYRCTEELEADVWLTANALGALFQLKKTPKGFKPAAVLARIHTLEELPALTGAYRSYFSTIEWVSEAVWEHGAPFERFQIFMLARNGTAELEFGESGTTPRLDPDWFDDPKWTGPINLDPVASSGHDFGIINRLRNGTVAECLSSVLKGMSGALLHDYDPDKAFAAFKLDGENEILAKLTDGKGIQKLLDGSLEQFFNVWPANGFMDRSGILIGHDRRHPAAASFPPFWKSQNARYIALALGIPETWLEKDEPAAPQQNQ
jgi:hypothetical protein